jgi:hypothetical protein
MLKYQSEAMNLIRSSNNKIEVPPHVLCISIFFVLMLLETGWEGKSRPTASNTISSLRLPEKIILI